MNDWSLQPTNARTNVCRQPLQFTTINLPIGSYTNQRNFVLYIELNFEFVNLELTVSE